MILSIKDRWSFSKILRCYKNLKKEDLSKRDTLEYINNRYLNFLKKTLNNPKCKGLRGFIKTCIAQTKKEIRNEKIASNKNNLLIKNKSLKDNNAIINELKETIIQQQHYLKNSINFYHI